MAMEVLSQSAIERIIQLNNSDVSLMHSPNSSFDASDGSIIDAEAQGVNKKLMRLAVDSRTSTKRQSYHNDEPAVNNKSEFHLPQSKSTPALNDHLNMKQLNDDDNTRFPRMEEMSHFHYSSVDFGGAVKVSLCEEENEDTNDLDTGQALLMRVFCKDKNWVIKRSQEDLVGFDRQIHRCLYDRRYSKLPELFYYDEPKKLNTSMVQQIQWYLSRFSQVTGNNVNCGPILNWLELDNHGNHLVVMEADDSAINVPAVAAGRVIKRYQAQAPDEITLEVGDLLSVIDMPSTDETIWWRGKKGFDVGFFPSHCVEILGDKIVNETLINQLNSRTIHKRRGKFISFLRFFFKSRPSKDELMQHGILRERVFGCDLGELLAITGHDVPLVVSMCAEVIEEHGIVDGLYRLSGITSNLQKLRVAFNNDEHPPNLLDPRFLHDIHCISSLMKTYFRELPNPLFTFELYDKFVMAINKEDDSDKTVAFHHVIQRLPPPHYRTMNKLFSHLNYCASKSDSTNMTAKNLAIVWAPNLLRPNVDDSVAALTEFRTQAIIVEYMIRNVDIFFDNNKASAAIAYFPEVADASKSEGTSEIGSSSQVSIGTKLISLEEARRRVVPHQKLSQSLSLGNIPCNSPHQGKLRLSTRVPPTVAANPVSPLPTLLSLEEAQAKNKSRFNLGRRGSSDQVLSTSNDHNLNSPKRNRKWFGLFSRSKSPTAVDGKPSIVSHPKSIDKTDQATQAMHLRSQSEPQFEGLEKQQLSQQSSNKLNEKSRSSWYLSFGDDNLDYGKVSGDEESLLSAVVAVSQKYSTLEQRRLSKQHRRSFSMGDPSELRKIMDTTTFEPPTNTDSKLHEKPPLPVNNRFNEYQNEVAVSNENPAYVRNSAINSSGERKHSIPKNDSSDGMLPVKRIRSQSPVDYNMSIEESENAEQTRVSKKGEGNSKTPEFKGSDRVRQAVTAKSSIDIKSLNGIQKQDPSIKNPDGSPILKKNPSRTFGLIAVSKAKEITPQVNESVPVNVARTVNLTTKDKPDIISSVDVQALSKNSVQCSGKIDTTDMRMRESSPKVELQVRTASGVIPHGDITHKPSQKEPRGNSLYNSPKSRRYPGVSKGRDSPKSRRQSDLPKGRPYSQILKEKPWLEDDVNVRPRSKSSTGPATDYEISRTTPTKNIFNNHIHQNSKQSYAVSAKDEKPVSVSREKLSENRSLTDTVIGKNRNYENGSFLNVKMNEKKRNSSDDEVYMDFLVKRTEDQIRSGNVNELIKCDAKEGELPQSGALIRFTQDKFRRNFKGKNHANEYILKRQQTIDEIKLKKNSEQQNLDRKTKSSPLLENIENVKLKKEIVSSVDLRSNSIDVRIPKNGEMRERSLSVKGRAAIFNSPPPRPLKKSSQGNLSKNFSDEERTPFHERTKSHPNLYLRTEFSSHQNQARTHNIITPEKDQIKKYTKEFNKRHSAYVSETIHNSNKPTTNSESKENLRTLHEYKKHIPPSRLADKSSSGFHSKHKQHTKNENDYINVNQATPIQNANKLKQNPRPSTSEFAQRTYSEEKKNNRYGPPPTQSRSYPKNLNTARNNASEVDARIQRYSDSSEYHNDTLGVRLGNLPLTLYNGSSMDRNKPVAKLKPVRPVSMYENRNADLEEML